MHGRPFPTNAITLLSVALLLWGAIIGVGSGFSQHVVGAPELNAAAEAPGGSAVVTRGNNVELQQLRTSQHPFVFVDLSTRQPGNDWSLLSSDARPLGTPTLQSQAVRLQI